MPMVNSGDDLQPTRSTVMNTRSGQKMDNTSCLCGWIHKIGSACGVSEHTTGLLTSSLTAAPACVRPALATGECIKRRRRAIADRALTSPENDRIIVEGRWRAFGTAEAGNHTTDVQTSGLKSEPASALNRRQSP